MPGSPASRCCRRLVAWRLAMDLRTLAYRRGWLPSRRLGAPTVAVGNLTVGGSGKTPIASWVASWYATHGMTPGILLRGYRGGDEGLVHSERLPQARVVANPDRHAGAGRAIAEGAEVLVLDDAFQRLDVVRDLDIAVVSAETSRAVGWPLPAGPWREGLTALGRADLVVVTRKRAPAEDALAFARSLARWTGAPVAIARLEVTRYAGMRSGREVSAASLAGQRVVAASGIGDPEALHRPDQGHRRRSAGGDLAGPPRLPGRGPGLAGQGGTAGRSPGDHPEGRREAPRPLACRRPRAAGGAVRLGVGIGPGPGGAGAQPVPGPPNCRPRPGP